MEAEGEKKVLWLPSSRDVQPLPGKQSLMHVVVVWEDKCFHKKNHKKSAPFSFFPSDFIDECEVKCYGISLWLI